MEVKTEIIVRSRPEAKDLPDSFILNIAKMADQQNKLADLKWLSKMLLDAQKKHQKAIQARALKLEKEQEEKKKREENKLKKEQLQAQKRLELEKKKAYLKKYEAHPLMKEMPFVKDFNRKLFKKLRTTAWIYINENYGLWTLFVMAHLEQPKYIHSLWAVQCAATLQAIGIEKIVELRLCDDSDKLYSYINTEGEFKKFYDHRKPYMEYANNVIAKTIQEKIERGEEVRPLGQAKK